MAVKCTKCGGRHYATATQCPKRSKKALEKTTDAQASATCVLTTPGLEVRTSSSAPDQEATEGHLPTEDSMMTEPRMPERQIGIATVIPASTLIIAVQHNCSRAYATTIAALKARL
jgi:hypothetical protein